eukprot:GGOE01008919.1.p6 GENE.GGOE01008919.1~~GGOE01008919.1.p6  ORF type:complete len:119 (-),score=14.51 GGOE01008919.1:1837-2157(-)
MAHLAVAQKFLAGGAQSDPMPDPAPQPLNIVGEEPSSPIVLMCVQSPLNVKAQRRKMMSERPHRVVSNSITRRLKFDDADLQWAEVQQAQEAVALWPGAVNWSAAA